MSDKLDNEIDEILGDLFVATHGGNTASDLGTSNVDSVDYSKAKAKLLQMFTAGATSPMQSSFQDLGEGKGNKVNTDQLTEARIDELEQIQALDDKNQQLANLMLKSQLHVEEHLAQLKSNKERNR